MRTLCATVVLPNTPLDTKDAFAVGKIEANRKSRIFKTSQHQFPTRLRAVDFATGLCSGDQCSGEPIVVSTYVVSSGTGTTACLFLQLGVSVFLQLSHRVFLMHCS